MKLKERERGGEGGMESCVPGLTYWNLFLFIETFKYSMKREIEEVMIALQGRAKVVERRLQ